MIVEWQATARTETALRAVTYTENTIPVTRWEGEIIFNTSQSEFRADTVIIRLSLDSGLFN